MKFEEGSECPVCENGELKLELRDERFTYQGYSLTFNDCQILICSNCGEGLFPEGMDSVIDDTLTSYRFALHTHFGVAPPKR